MIHTVVDTLPLIGTEGESYSKPARDRHQRKKRWVADQDRATDALHLRLARYMGDGYNSQ